MGKQQVEKLLFGYDESTKLFVQILVFIVLAYFLSVLSLFLDDEGGCHEFNSLSVHKKHPILRDEACVRRI